MDYALHEVGGDAGGECYLIVPTGGAVALVDTGFAYCAHETYRRIEEVLGDRPVDYLLLTHSHYDHASAGGYLKQKMPDMQVVAAARVARVFDRPGAVETMKRLNDSQAKARGLVDYEDISNVSVDRIVADGDIIDLRSMRFEVLDAPGHTRDSLAFWCAEEGLLIGCETMGVYGGPMPETMPALPDGTPAPDATGITMQVSPAYLVGLQSSFDHMDRVLALHPRVMVVPHSKEPFAGPQAEAYLRAARYWGAYLSEVIRCAHRLGWSDDRICEHCKSFLYSNCIQKVQPEPAFDLNLSITVPMVIAEAE